MVLAQLRCSMPKQPPQSADEKRPHSGRQDAHISNGTISLCSVRSSNIGHDRTVPLSEALFDAQIPSVGSTPLKISPRTRSLHTFYEDVALCRSLEESPIERAETEGLESNIPSGLTPYKCAEYATVNHNIDVRVNNHLKKGYRVLLDPTTGDVEALVSPRTVFGFLESRRDACSLEDEEDTHYVTRHPTCERTSRPQGSSFAPSGSFAELEQNTPMRMARSVWHEPGAGGACKKQASTKKITLRTTPKEKNELPVSHFRPDDVKTRLMQHDLRKSSVHDVKRIMSYCATALETGLNNTCSKTDYSEKRLFNSCLYTAGSSAYSTHSQHESENPCPPSPAAGTTSQASTAVLLNSSYSNIKPNKDWPSWTVRQSCTPASERVLQRRLQKSNHLRRRLLSTESSTPSSSTRAPSSTQDLQPCCDEAGSDRSSSESVTSLHSHSTTQDSTQRLLDYIPDPFTAAEIFWHSSNAFYQTQTHHFNGIFPTNQKGDTRPSLGSYLGTLFEQCRRADPLMEFKKRAPRKRFYQPTVLDATGNTLRGHPAPVFLFPHRSKVSVGTANYLSERSKIPEAEVSYTLKNKTYSSALRSPQSSPQVSTRPRRLNDVLHSDFFTPPVCALFSPRRPEAQLLRNIGVCFCSEAC